MHVGGKREGAGSVFSDTMSNPDADEIYFWKQKDRTAVAPTGFAFNIGPPTPAASNLKLQRQHSPLEGLYQFKDDMMSPGARHQSKPVLKIGNSGGSGHLKKPHAHKRERGRRACSEQGPDRNDFGLTSSAGAATNQFNKDDEHKKAAGGADEVEAELQRILDAKLDSSMAK